MKMFMKIIIWMLIFSTIQASESIKVPKYAKKTFKTIKDTRNYANRTIKTIAHTMIEAYPTETIASLKKTISSTISKSEEEFKNSVITPINQALDFMPDGMKHIFLAGLTTILLTYLPLRYALLLKIAIDLIELKILRNKTSANHQSNIPEHNNNDFEGKFKKEHSILKPIIETMYKVPPEWHIVYLNGLTFVLGRILPPPVNSLSTMAIDSLKLHVIQNWEEKRRKRIQKSENLKHPGKESDNEKLKSVGINLNKSLDSNTQKKNSSRVKNGRKKSRTKNVEKISKVSSWKLTKE